MRKKITPQKNSTTKIKKKKRSIRLMKLEDVVPKIVSKSPWSVKKLIVLDNYLFQVKFYDGTEGLVDMKARVKSKKAGVFAALKDPDLFNQAFIQFGVVTWPGEIDLAPDAMHAAIKKKGKWILR